MKLRISKTELALAALVALVGLGGLAVTHIMNTANPSGATIATIARDGEVIQTINLDAVKEPYELRLEDARGMNIVAVEPGRISMKEADCPDKVCVNAGWTHDPAHPIACVPHGLTITISRDGNDTHDLDAQTR